MPYVRARCKGCGQLLQGQVRALRGVGRCCLPCSDEIAAQATSLEAVAALLAGAHPTPDYPDCLVNEALMLREPQYGPLIWHGTPGGISIRWLLYGKPTGGYLRWVPTCGNPACIRREHMAPGYKRVWMPKSKTPSGKSGDKPVNIKLKCVACGNLHDAKTGGHSLLGRICGACAGGLTRAPGAVQSSRTATRSEETRDERV